MTISQITKQIPGLMELLGIEDYEAVIDASYIGPGGEVTIGGNGQIVFVPSDPLPAQNFMVESQTGFWSTSLKEFESGFEHHGPTTISNEGGESAFVEYVIVRPK